MYIYLINKCYIDDVRDILLRLVLVSKVGQWVREGMTYRNGTHLKIEIIHSLAGFAAEKGWSKLEWRPSKPELCPPGGEPTNLTGTPPSGKLKNKQIWSAIIHLILYPST